LAHSAVFFYGIAIFSRMAKRNCAVYHFLMHWRGLLREQLFAPYGEKRQGGEYYTRVLRRWFFQKTAGPRIQ